VRFILGRLDAPLNDRYVILTMTAIPGICDTCRMFRAQLADIVMRRCSMRVQDICYR